MVTEYTENQTKESIIASPRDEILDGVIIKIDKGLLSEFIDPKVHSKFDNLEQPTLNITIDVKFNDKVIKVTDRIAYYKEPMTNSKLGKFLNKYDKLEVGKQIKVFFNSEGFGNIQY